MAPKKPTSSSARSRSSSKDIRVEKPKQKPKAEPRKKGSVDAPTISSSVRESSTVGRRRTDKAKASVPAPNLPPDGPRPTFPDDDVDTEQKSVAYQADAENSPGVSGDSGVVVSSDPPMSESMPSEQEALLDTSDKREPKSDQELPSDPLPRAVYSPPWQVVYS